MKKKLSIIFPVYNEVENLENLIKSWYLELNKYKVSAEFIIVEDGSTDGTKELIVNISKTYPIKNLSQDKRRGYSKAVVDGIFAAEGEYIVCTDSDNQVRVNSLISNLHNLPGKNFFLIGFRNPRKDPFNRLLYSKLFKVYHDFLFNSGLKDPSCPFVIGKNKNFKSLPKDSLLKMKEGFWWGFVGICLKMNYKFKEVPIEHFGRNFGIAGYKLKNLPVIILRNFIGLLKIKLNQNK